CRNHQSRRRSRLFISGRTRSPSVMIPTNLPSASQTGTPLIACCASVLAISVIVALGATVTTKRVMISAASIGSLQRINEIINARTWGLDLDQDQSWPRVINRRPLRSSRHVVRTAAVKARAGSDGPNEQGPGGTGEATTFTVAIRRQKRGPGPDDGNQAVNPTLRE